MQHLEEFTTYRAGGACNRNNGISGNLFRPSHVLTSFVHLGSDLFGGKLRFFEILSESSPNSVWRH